LWTVYLQEIIKAHARFHATDMINPSDEDIKVESSFTLPLIQRSRILTRNG